MSVHCVVVWEWQYETGGHLLWAPHSPGVTRALERAHDKRLTRVVLADADPDLAGHVNLRSLTQCVDNPDGSVSECPVRRSCYSVQSCGGRGVLWEWELWEGGYVALPMEAQCRLEEAGGLVLAGWRLSADRLAAERPTARRRLRRSLQPPYPRVRNTPPPPPPPPHPQHNHDRVPIEGRRPRIPHQHTGSSVHSAHSAHSVHSAQSVKSVQSEGALRRGGRSVSPRERKPNLARQILHNLNIFSHNSKSSGACATDVRHVEGGVEGEGEGDGEGECGSRSGRRHSVDTVSTYLSHESKESLQRGSVGELLNCSAGSDDVFESALTPLTCADLARKHAHGHGQEHGHQHEHGHVHVEHEHAHADHSQPGTIVGADSAMEAMCAFLRPVAQPQWGALCPACLRPLAPAAPRAAPTAPAAVALVACQHMMHLHCLNQHLAGLRDRGEPLSIECLVCGETYGLSGGAATGEQPPGSMAWRVQPEALPHHPPDSSSILVTYNFQSGVQGAAHPAPGAPYYAVGFPRHSLLPDTPLGRQVLSLLRVCWERRVLFGVSASRTTGADHVVAWRVPPPPSAAAHYRAPHAHPARLLAAAHGLHRLLAASTASPVAAADT